MADGPRYYRVSPKFWSSADRLGWDEETRLLALYILTCEHRTTEGLFRLPKQYIMADLEWSPQRLAQPFDRLCADGFIEYDHKAKVVLIVKALAYQSPNNPNGVTAALRALAIVPETGLDQRFYALAQQYCERLAEQLPERFTQPIAHPPALAPAPAPKPMSVADATDDEFDRFWNEYPRHHDTKAIGGGGVKTEARKAWNRLSRTQRDEVLAALEPYAKVCRPDGQKPKHAERFLKNDAWKPYLPEARDGPPRDRVCPDCDRSLDADDHDQLCDIWSGRQVV